MNSFRNYLPASQSGNATAVALPGLLGEMERHLVATGADPSIVLGHLCAYASLIAQGVADGVWPNEAPLPAGVSVMLVVPTGVGKSVVSGIVGAPLHAAVGRHVQLLSEDSGLDSDADTGGSDSSKTPKSLQLLVEDVSASSLAERLDAWPNAGLFTEEMDQVGELIKKNSGMLAKLSDGTPYSRSRGNSRRVVLRGHRLVFFLQGQPDVFQKSQGSLGGKGTGGIGLINRFMLFKAQHTQDSSNYLHVKVPDEVASAYSRRVEELVDTGVELVHQGRERTKIRLCQQGCLRLEAMLMETRRIYASNPAASFMSGYVNRHAERVLRLAVALHVFEHGTSGPVSLEILERADAIGRSALADYFAQVHVPPVVSQAEGNAIRVADFVLASFLWHIHPEWVDYRAFYDQAFNLGLSGAQFNAALLFLAKRGLVAKDGRGSQKRIGLNLPGLSSWRRDQMQRRLSLQ